MQKRFFHLTLVFFALLAPYLSSAQQTVGLFTKTAGEQDGYVLFSPNMSDYTYLIDKCGKLVHKWNTGSNPGLDAYLLPNGNLLSTGKIVNPYFNSTGSSGGLIQILDWNGNTLWSYTISDSITHQDHDVYPMPNGDILVCEWERFTASQAIAAGRDSVKLAGSPIWSMKVQEIKPVGTNDAQVVWQWRLWDHLIQDHDTTKPNFGIVKDHPELMNLNYVDPLATSLIYDWTHENAVTYNPKLDQVMISSRSLSEIYILDHSTTTAEAASHGGGNHGKGGDFLYRWGNPAAYDRGTATNRTLYVQHNPSWIPDGYVGAGSISVFNDGTNRPGGNYSSADIFMPPVDSDGNYRLDSGKAYGPDSSYWSYVAPNPTDFYSNVQGGVQRLQNGNTLICAATTGEFFEIDSNKNIVWQYVNPDNQNIVSQGSKPGYNDCFRANLYMENYPAFNNITLEPGNPIEQNPYVYDCFMPFRLYGKPIYKIIQVKGYKAASGVADSVDTYCYLKGIVQSGNLSGNTSQYFSLQDSTGAISIITSSIINGYKPTVGDSILVRGVVLQANGLTYFSADSVSKLTVASQISPAVISLLSENAESELVNLKGYRLVDTAKWDTTGANGSFEIKAANGSDSIMLKIVSGTNLYNNEARPSGTFDVTGIEGQEDTSIPYFTNYYLIPRSISDFSVSSGITSVISTSNQVEVYPNPVSNSLRIMSSLEIKTLQITDMLGSVLFSKSDVAAKTITVDLSLLKEGVYFVRVCSETGSETVKIDKE